MITGRPSTGLAILWAALALAGLVGAGVALRAGSFFYGGVVLGLSACAGGALAGWLLADNERRKARASTAPDPCRRDRELASLRAQLTAVQTELDAVEASISHDLRSPIGSVLNYAAVLRADHGDELGTIGRATLAGIRRSAESALSLLDGLLRLSHTGRQELHRQPLDMQELVQEAFETIPSSNAELAVGSLPPARGDAALLRTAFAELLDNAVKFSSRNEKPRVTVDGHVDGAGRRVYRVVDEGVGFDARFAGRLFQVFERVHSREQFPGAGVGLALVRRIVERHGGSIWVDAEAGRGATFHVALPDVEDGVS